MWHDLTREEKKKSKESPLNCKTDDEFIWQVYNQDRKKEKKRKENRVPSHLHGEESAGSVSTPQDPGTGSPTFTLSLDLGSLPLYTYVKVQPWRKAEYFRTKRVGFLESDWMNTKPSLFQHSSWGVILGQCFTRHQAQSREISQLEETGAWHILHCMSRCSQDRC